MKLIVSPAQLHFGGTVLVVLGLGIVVSLFGMFSLPFFIFFLAACIVPYVLIPRFIEIRRGGSDNRDSTDSLD